MRPVLIVLALCASADAQITVFPATPQTPSMNLATTLLGNVGQVHSANRVGFAPQFGTYLASGGDNYDLWKPDPGVTVPFPAPPREGIVLSTGQVANYSSGPDTSPRFTTGWGNPARPAENALLQPVTNMAANFDPARLNFTFSAFEGRRVVFTFVFGSEEWPSYVNKPWTDGFGIYLNGHNIARTPDWQLINVNNPNFPNTPVVETELNNVIVWNGTPRVRVTCTMPTLINTLDIIIGDASDDILDSTVYLETMQYLDCKSDFNGDGVVNSSDYAAFLFAYMQQDITADYNGDGVVNLDDRIIFETAYNGGC